jgi:hypothetical protein
LEVYRHVLVIGTYVFRKSCAVFLNRGILDWVGFPLILIPNTSVSHTFQNIQVETSDSLRQMPQVHVTYRNRVSRKTQADRINHNKHHNNICIDKDETIIF